MNAGRSWLGILLALVLVVEAVAMATAPTQPVQAQASNVKVYISPTSPTSHRGWLYTLDTGTVGALIDAAAQNKFGLSGTHVYATAFEVVGETLYAVIYNSSSGRGLSHLYTVDLETGRAHRVGNRELLPSGSSDALYGLAYHKGVMYSLGTRYDRLYRVDLATGAGTIVNRGLAQLGAAVSDPGPMFSDGKKLYVINNSNDALYTVNPSTGRASRVAPGVSNYGLVDPYETVTFRAGGYWGGAGRGFSTGQHLYTFDVAAGTAVREPGGPASVISDVRAMAGWSPVPVKSATAEGTSASEGTVSITLPTASPGGKNVYVRHMKEGGSGWEDTESVSTRTTTATHNLTGLDRNTAYRVQASGDSAFPWGGTVETSFRTEDEADHTPEINRVRLTDTEEATTNFEVSLSRALPGGQTVYGRYQTGTGAWTALNPVGVTGSVAVFSVAGLAPDTAYTFQASLGSNFAPDSTLSATATTRPMRQEGSRVYISPQAPTNLRGHLYTLDPGTVTAALDAESQDKFRLTGANVYATAFAAAGETLYAVIYNNAAGAGLSHLYTVDEATGRATRVGNGRLVPRVSTTSVFYGLAYLNGVMYGTDDTYDGLFAIDLTDGTGRLVAPTATDFGASISSPGPLFVVDNTLYMVSNDDFALYSLNTANGTPSRVNSGIARYGLASNLTFYAAGTVNGVGYGLTNTERLYAFDVSDGTASEVDGGPVGASITEVYAMAELVPVAVTGASAEGTSAVAGQVSFTVSAASPGGKSIYVRHKKEGGSGWEATENVSMRATTASHNLTGLDPNTAYKVQVSGDSTFPSGGTVQASFRTEDDASLAPAINRVRFTDTQEAATNFEVSLSRSLPGGQTVHGRYRAGTGAWTTLEAKTVTGSVAVFSVGGLFTETTYTFEASLNSDFSPSSLIATTTTTALEVIRYQPPTVTRVNAGPRRDDGTRDLVISWSEESLVTPWDGFHVRINGGPYRDAGNVSEFTWADADGDDFSVDVRAYYIAGPDAPKEVQLENSATEEIPAGTTRWTSWSREYTLSLSPGESSDVMFPGNAPVPELVEPLREVMELSGGNPDDAETQLVVLVFFLAVGGGGGAWWFTGKSQLSAILGGVVFVLIWVMMGWQWAGVHPALVAMPLLIIFLVTGFYIYKAVR